MGMWGRLAGSAIASAGLYAARQYYRNRGTTKDECQTPLPGDELVGQPAVQTTEGVGQDVQRGRGDPQVVEQCAATDEDLPAGRVGGARCPVRLEEDPLSPFALNPP